MSDSPKIDMAVEYLQKHYPKYVERLASNSLIATVIMSPEHSNTQVEDIIDKVAILQHLTKEAA